MQVKTKKKYEVFLTDDHFISVDGSLEWASEFDTSAGATHTKPLGHADTIEEAKELIYANGRQQDMFPSCFIYTKEDGEVYSSIPAVTKCKCCGREEWERIENEYKS